MSVHRHKPMLMFLALALGWGAAWCAHGQSVSVKAAVEKDRVSVAEPFMFQIQVEGSDSPSQPVLPPMPAFEVQPQGGGANNRQQVVIRNGQVERQVERNYVFNYRLIPRSEGVHSIPPIPVQVDGQTLETQAIAIQVQPPQQSGDFAFELRLEKNQLYVGEPVVLTGIWYFRTNVREVMFSAPLLESSQFTITPLEPDSRPGERMYELEISGHRVVARKGQRQYNGQPHATLEFQLVLVPRQAGAQEFPAATVACQGLVANQGRTNRRRDPFDGFFSDDFFRSPFDRGEYQTFVSKSDPMSIEVKPLPEEGRPANFSGLVGEYAIEAEATPTKVNVGDPITLKIRVGGSRFLDHVELPPLDGQADLKAHFKIPEERASGEAELGVKVFTQTIRALDASVEAIPPIKLPYFDTASGRYQVAQSRPIPLEVGETKVLTTADVEGMDNAPVRNRLTARREGIAHNYSGTRLLESHVHGPARWVQSPLWLAALLFPPLIFVLLLVLRMAKRARQLSPAEKRRRQALQVFTAKMKSAAQEDGGGHVLEALQDYLGAKLGLPSRALTHADVEPRLEQQGVPREVLTRLAALFDACTATRYAGNQGAGNGEALAQEAQGMVRELEAYLK